MNDRLQKFLDAENISQALFADTIGVARASVSHILSGRNKPGYDFITGMMTHYPSLNVEWLLSGKGRMYKDSASAKEITFSDNDESVEDDTLFSEFENESKISDATQVISDDGTSGTDNVSQAVCRCDEPAKSGRRIERVVVFYDNNTFEEIR